MYLGAAAARFAPHYQNEDMVSLQNAYALFCESYRNSVPLRRRLLAWLLPPLALVNRNAAVLLVLIFLAGMNTMAQDAGTDADNLYRNALEAEYAEYWERAIDLLREGSLNYPDDARFPRTLGRLYYSRSLYGLAWDEYRKVEQLNPFDTYVLLRLASIAGYLNRDRTSVAYLEKLLAIDPENKEAIGNLGWMYYKVHRLKDGERLLVSALEHFGEDADLSMTMATVYSDMYRYDEGKYWYQKSIALGEPVRSFTAVAHYNLSILESRFYRYDLALDEANASLDAQYRSSGLLARGELNMRRLDLEKAQADFQAAREIDPSPLSKINLAQIYQISGRLEEARAYALDCLKTSDHSWMLHYGIDPIRYKRDIHEILYKTYTGLSQAERFKPHGTPVDAIRSMYRAASFRFYTSVHRKLYQKYSLAAGDAYSERFIQNDIEHDIPPLDQFIQYYNAFETYPRRALFYLDKARNFETVIIPASEATYDLEKGILLKDPRLMAKALGELDPVWEGELISRCYREMVRRSPLRDRQSVAEELFALNRGALLQTGIGLPVRINLHNDGKANLASREKALYRALAKTGFLRHKGGEGEARFREARFGEARFSLDISVYESPDGTYTAACELIDKEGDLSPLRKIIPLRSLSRADIYTFAGALSDAMFRVE